MIITKALIYNAKNIPERLAILDEGYSFTYGELASRTAKLKEALKDLGIKKGDKVGIFLLNTFRYVELFYAITAIGAIAVPLNTRLSRRELEYIVKDSEMECLFFHSEYLQHIPSLEKAAKSNLKSIFVSDVNEQSEYTHYEELIKNRSITELTYDDISEDDIACIFYTGGTTGPAVGVMLSHRNQVSNFYHTTTKFNYNEWSNYLHAAPMFHLADFGKTIGVTWGGGTHSFIKTFTVKGFLEVVQTFKPTVISLVPTMINMVMNDPDFKNYDVSSIKKINYGSSAMSPDLFKRVMNAFPDVEFYQSYGMTEASPVLTMLEPEDHLVSEDKKAQKRLSSVGKSVPGVEVRVVDDTGNDVAPGEVGEVIARGPNIMKGYWNSPEKTKNTIIDGWYHSGDMALIDEDHYIYIVDRKKDMIITGGENVYSIEVENVLTSHPSVLEAAVIGIPDSKWGEAIKAVIVVRDTHELTESEIIEFSKSLLANYKVPKSVDFVEALPKSGAGKILKRELREKYWENYKLNVN
ncbi:fatty-acid--CoA ligase [Sporosarcina sp. P13]|uniref:long-chain-fatty-acid--CoA ligase n=1 Tax=Sporosarcina sp. P13 TaxID=2048263 RepID=UPI000C166FB8|nr:long-chain-fatty-acid--CoA ligase [Sporosarcina sp. P13]PIC64899.1 fatty-acid--CoA ligase [Sporosarcina sp. P13]